VAEPVAGVEAPVPALGRVGQMEPEGPCQGLPLCPHCCHAASIGQCGCFDVLGDGGAHFEFFLAPHQGLGAKTRGRGGGIEDVLNLCWSVQLQRAFLLGNNTKPKSQRCVPVSSTPSLRPFSNWFTQGSRSCRTTTLLPLILNQPFPPPTSHTRGQWRRNQAVLHHALPGHELPFRGIHWDWIPHNMISLSSTPYTQ